MQKIPGDIVNLMPKGSHSILDLFAAGGSQWWKANGRQFDGKFDLTPGSRSMRVLEAYMKEHFKRKPASQSSRGPISITFGNARGGYVPPAERKAGERKVEDGDTFAPWQEEILDRVWAKIGKHETSGPQEKHGDVEGHPFHGNQWTDGEGGAADDGGGEAKSEADSMKAAGLPADSTFHEIAGETVKQAITGGRYDVSVVKHETDSYEETFTLKFAPKLPPDAVPYKKYGEVRGYVDPTLGVIKSDEFGEYPRLRADSGLFDSLSANARSDEFQSMGLKSEEGVLWRGMDAGAWNEAVKAGEIKSPGLYNIGEKQVGRTYWTTDPGSAESYAHGFAPWQFKAGYGRNAIVVKIADPKIADTTSEQGHERGIPGPVNLSHVLEVYEGIPYAFKPGTVDIIRKLRNSDTSFREGSRSSPDTSVGWRKANWRKRASVHRAEAVITYLANPSVREVFAKHLSELDAWKLADKIASAAESDMREAFLAAISAVQDGFDVAEVAKAIEGVSDAGKAAAAALRSARWFDVANGELRSDLVAVTTQIINDSGKAAVATLGGTLKGAEADFEMVFDIKHPEAVAWVKEHAGEMIKGITESQQDSVKQIMERAWEEGLAPRDAAALIRETIGLLPRQEAALDAYETEMEGEGLDDATIEKRKSRYLDELLNDRAMVIARHETIVSAYQGHREAWRQADEEDLLSDEAVQEWVAATDTRVCDLCASLEGKTAKLDEPFTDDDGKPILNADGEEIYQPGDAHIQDRCGIVLRPYGKPKGEQRPPDRGDEGAPEPSDAGSE
jgi:hypothetical protein